MVLKRSAGAPLFEGSHRRSSRSPSTGKTKPAANVVGVILAGAGAADRQPGVMVIGAHYDHLGTAAPARSLPTRMPSITAPTTTPPAPPACSRWRAQLAASKAELRRDVYLVAFSGEEEGVFGSTAFTRLPRPA